MEWFERWFGEEYLLVYEHRDVEEAEREVATIRKVLDIKGGELVIDLCCGSGRHDYPLVRAGCRVIGLDYSGHLLEIAKAAREPGAEYPKYLRADARDTVFRDGAFDVALNLFTSFGYFSDKENHEFLHTINRLLKPGGRYYIDYLNPPRVLKELVRESVRENDRAKIIEKRKYDEETRRIVKTIALNLEGETQVFHESVRLYQLDEMLSMLSEAGLSIDGTLGSVGGDPYSETSDRMIVYGRSIAPF